MSGMVSGNSVCRGSGYMPSLQSLRFVFCMLIFVCHYLHMTSDARFDYGGDAGVVFFFILSGFVLSRGYGGSVSAPGFSLMRFMRKRVARLYPLHMLTLAVALLMSMMAGARLSVAKTALHVLMLQCFTLSADVMNYGNGPSWFLGTLMFCYALFPMAHRAVAECHGGSWAFCLSYVLAYGVIVSRCGDHLLNDSLYAFPLLRVGDFVLGIVAYHVYTLPVSVRLRRRIGGWSASSLTVCDALVVGICVSTAFVYGCLPLWSRMSMLFWLPFALLVYWLAVSDGSHGGLSRLLRCRALVSLGDMSFEIYMMHCIVITLCNFAWGRALGYGDIPGYVHFAICLAATVVASRLYSVVEARMRKGTALK